MARWPRSGWAQAGIAVAVASGAVVVCYRPIDRYEWNEAIRTAPHDGQDGLAVFAGTLGAEFAIWVCTVVVLVVAQRLFNRRP